MAHLNGDPPKEKRAQDPCDLEDNYYTSRQLSKKLNLSMEALAMYRRKGIGPKYILVGYRSCRYAKEEVLKYIEEMTRTSASARNHNINP